MTDKLPKLIFETGPGSPEWGKLLKLARQNRKTGYNCAIATPLRASVRRRAVFDQDWARSFPFVDYDHATGLGSIALTYGGARYTFTLRKADELVEQVIIPFDLGKYDAIGFVGVMLDLNAADKCEPARTQSNGFNRPEESGPVEAVFSSAPAQRSQRRVTAAGEEPVRAERTSRTIVTRAHGGGRKRNPVGKWTRREKSLAGMVERMAKRASAS